MIQCFGALKYVQGKASNLYGVTHLDERTLMRAPEQDVVLHLKASQQYLARCARTGEEYSTRGLQTAAETFLSPLRNESADMLSASREKIEEGGSAGFYGSWVRPTK